MQQHFGGRLLAPLCFVSAAFGLLAPDTRLHADSADEDPLEVELLLESVIVTARRTEESLLDVSEAVSVVSSEEIDRLAAHVSAARDLLGSDGSVGRKFEFLSQEFNREANPLCSKSADAALTRTGLELKNTIDQLREQVQNIE